MKTLLLDNYDSFTHNLMQVIAVHGGSPVVHYNDAISVDDVRRMGITHIILSPGPGSPYEKRDIGISEELIAYAEREGIPLLGVCLGHQVLAKYYGAIVERAPVPFHGKSSEVTCETGCPLFSSVPQRTSVMRYHSLHAKADTIPQSLSITARTDDGIVMGLAHVSLPIYGVQFHPESIGTPLGSQMIKNFLSVPSRQQEGMRMHSLFHALFHPTATDQERSLAFETLVTLPITADLLVDAVHYLSERILPVELPGDPLDTCGTGGSRKPRFNTSTFVAFLAAACGAKVAKHGNRAASGRCGSFDLLEHLGVRFDGMSPDAALRLYEELRIVFLYAPTHHPILRTIAPLRRKHGKKTFFNLLGPLLNPARVQRQIIGAASTEDARVLAEALQRLGRTRACVVTGLDGLDEVSIGAPSLLLDIPSGSQSYFSPTDLGLPVMHAGIEGGDPSENARMFLDLAEGGGTESIRRLVLVNTALALVIAGISPSIEEGFARASETLARGDVLRVFTRYRDLSSVLL